MYSNFFFVLFINFFPFWLIGSLYYSFFYKIDMKWKNFKFFPHFSNWSLLHFEPRIQKYSNFGPPPRVLWPHPGAGIFRTLLFPGGRYLSLLGLSLKAFVHSFDPFWCQNSFSNFSLTPSFDSSMDRAAQL